MPSKVQVFRTLEARIVGTLSVGVALSLCIVLSSRLSGDLTMEESMSQQLRSQGYDVISLHPGIPENIATIRTAGGRQIEAVVRTDPRDPERLLVLGLCQVLPDGSLPPGDACATP